MENKNTRRGFTQSCFPKGFTLIELLVVVLIISILAAVAVPQYQKAVAKSRVTQLWTTLNALEKAGQEAMLNGKNAKYLNASNENDFSLSFASPTFKPVCKHTGVAVYRTDTQTAILAFMPCNKSGEEDGLFFYLKNGSMKCWGFPSSDICNTLGLEIGSAPL